MSKPKKGNTKQKTEPIQKVFKQQPETENVPTVPHQIGQPNTYVRPERVFATNAERRATLQPHASQE